VNDRNFVPVEKRAYVQALMDRRNGLVCQCEELHAKITEIDNEIDAACEP
jgi:hypothetical protein